MARQQSILRIPIIWRGKKFVLELNSEASLLELGEELQKITDIKADTMKLIVPESSIKSSRLLAPFSNDHSSFKLQDTGIIEGKPLRMMGVLENEVDQVLKDAKAKLRIAGFEEEERRMKERISRGPQLSLKLPQGPYIFCEFRTLEPPGIKLNPPPSEALKRMHMLAADPGIVAIMNKHRWRVGMMTEMAPVGYVGVSPKCLLGLNKNHGEEISLRLRTDDLKGFRKYQVIKKTLLHELAHMVFSEHDENFYALDKQLNQEALSLDWTRSKSHTLANTRFSDDDDDFDMNFELESSLPQKLGGESSAMAASARAASVAAAYNRFADHSTKVVGAMKMDELEIGNQHNGYSDQDELESDPNYSEVRKTMVLEAAGEVNESITDVHHSSCGDCEMRTKGGAKAQEPDHDDSEGCKDGMVVDRIIDSVPIDIENNAGAARTTEEPDPDDNEALISAGNSIISDTFNHGKGDHSQVGKVDTDPPMPDPAVTGFMPDEPDPDDEELRRIQDPVIIFCDKLNKAIKILQNELNPSELVVVQQTLIKIIRNVSENPSEMKYKKLRKANPILERSIAKHKAALEVLFLVGFSEEVIVDEFGKSETYLMLKRNDPGLMWLAKSCLETASVK